MRVSLATKAAGNLVWATLTTVAARAVTIVSTFVLTRYLTPEAQGEVNLAFVLVATAGAASALGMSQYVAANPQAGRETTFHCTVLVLAAGALACIGVVLIASPAAGRLGVPGMARYIPGLAFAHYIERCGWVPRSILVREMRFRSLGLRIATSELAFAACSVVFAVLGLGGHAIVLGGLARSSVGLAFLLAATERREWLSPCRLSLETFRRLLRFGFPLSVSFLFRLGAMTWDTTFMGYRFGESAAGVYNQAYRLAELPVNSVGDQCNDVLVPAFARAEGAAARRRGFLRAASLITFVVAPMAFGLGAVAPAIVAVFYPPAYADVAPFLVVLAPLGLTRAIGSLCGAFLQVTGRTKSFAFIDLMLVVLVLGLMSALSQWGPAASSAGVLVAFTAALLVLLRSLRPDGISVSAVALAALRPLAGAAVMVAVVVASRQAWVHLETPPLAQLALEVLVGAAAYVAVSMVIARPIVSDFLGLARSLASRDTGSGRGAVPPP